MGGIHFGNTHGHEAPPLPPPEQPASFRVPSGIVAGIALALVVATALMPAAYYAWHLFVACLLGLVVALARIPPGLLLKRLLRLLPLLVCVTLSAAFVRSDPRVWTAVLLRSTLCLATMLVLNAIVPFGALPGLLKRWGFPALLVSTLTLLHSYVFILNDERQRMSKARAGRTLRRRRLGSWSALATVLGVLFVRASERAERVYLAMCSRGWK
jgi:cobalt/nickel transport system permease protein